MTRSAICPVQFFIYKWRRPRDVSSQHPVFLWPCVEWTGTGIRGSELFLWWSKPFYGCSTASRAGSLQVERLPQQLRCVDTAGLPWLSPSSAGLQEILTAPLFFLPGLLKRPVNFLTSLSFLPLPILFLRRLGLLMAETFASRTERQFSLDFRHSGDTALFWKLEIQFPKATLSAHSPKSRKTVYKFNNLYLLK